MSQMTVYKAIDEMRKLSEDGVPFSFSFMSYSDIHQTSEGVVEVIKAKLKSRSKEAAWHNAPMIEEYIILDTLEHRRFYHCALMTFNGQALKLT